MNTYIEILNRIKSNYNISWLTSSQYKVFQEVKANIDSPYKTINIYGNEGVGKTFFGWILQQEGFGKYVSSIDALNEKYADVILDNFDFKRNSFRELLIYKNKYKLNRMIILTRVRILDDIPGFKLDLNDEDINIFKSNLLRINVNIANTLSCNLWDYINSVRA